MLAHSNHTGCVGTTDPSRHHGESTATESLPSTLRPHLGRTMACYIQTSNRSNRNHLPEIALPASSSPTLLTDSTRSTRLLGLTGVGPKHPVARTVFIFLLDDLPPASGGFLASGGAAIIRSTTLDTPVEDVIVLEALTHKEIAEKLAEVRVVGLVIETKSPGVVEEDTELVRETAAKKIGGSGHFLLHDAVILLLLSCRLKALPRESTTKEVHQNICEGFKIVTTGLLNTQVGVNGCVASSTCEVLVLPVRNVQVSLRVAELLGKTEIDDVNLIATLSDAHKEIIGFDITVNEVARMDVFNARDKLICEQKNGLQAEFAVTKVEKVFQRRAKEIEHHRVVVTLSAEPPYERHTNASGKSLVDL